MGGLTALGLALGLAGVAGIKARYPILIMGLLTRYQDVIALRPPFKFLGNSLVLLIIALLVVLDTYAAPEVEGSTGYSVAKISTRILVGGVLFSGLFGGFSLPIAFLTGAAVTLISYLVNVQIMRRFAEGRELPYRGQLLDTTAFLTTVMLIVFPLIAYVVWLLLLFLLFRSRMSYDTGLRRYRHLR